MYIFTNSPSQTDDLFKESLNWVTPTENISNISILHDLVSQIGKYPFYTKTKSASSWNWLYHTDYSNKSQFDTLVKFVKNNLKCPDGVLFQADSGKNFHGQKNRVWEANKGNIHLSVLLTPNVSTKKMNSKFLAMTVTSIIEMLDSIPSLKEKSSIKWPNDIYIGSSKIGGIITQCFTLKNKVRAVVLGIGLNVETLPKISGDKFTPKINCLKNYSETIQINSIFFKLLESLYSHYQLLQIDKISKFYETYLKRSLVIEKTVKVHPNHRNRPLISGKVIGINNDLQLKIENISTPIKDGRLEVLDFF